MQAQRAITRYHDLIARDLPAAEEQLAQLVDLQITHKTSFGGRPLTHSLRPALLAESAYTDVQDSVYLLRQAILKIAGTFFNQDEALEELGLEEWERELISIPTNVIRLSASARMDAFLTPDSFKFVEVNGESPAGLGYVHQLGKIYQQIPIFQQFIREFPVRFVSPLEHLVHGLLRTYHEEFDGKELKPTFAIVDHLDVPTYNEFVLIKDYLGKFDMQCEIVDPRDLECRNGWIYANGRRIDILYRRLLMNEYYAIKDDCKAYLQGYKAQKTCYLNSFRTKLVHKKALFSFLTDEKYTRILAPQHVEAIEEHIPWTRRLRERKTSFYGLKIDLLDFVRCNRKYFVIKPNDAYGGSGVTLGFTATDSEWDAAVDEGLELGHVVQEVVDIHREPFLVKTSNGWQYQPSVVDLDPYLNGPLMGGCLVRTSATNLANVTAGGGTLPLFILRYQ
ncbi:MAG: hypothetical protein AAGI08_13880 [Bacteroidota bacterium]